MTWIPLVLAAAGLIVTFQAGLWNIGVDGQIVAGAIGATWIARTLSGPSAVVIAATIVAGAVAGALYALVPGYLRTRFEVHEIFSGVALNFLAGAVAVYLIIGPWSRAGVASTSGTDLIAERAWLPTLGTQRISLVAIIVAVAAVVGVAVLMRRHALRAAGQGGRAQPGERPADGRLATALHAVGLRHRRRARRCGRLRAGDRVPPQAGAVDLRRLRLPGRAGRAAGRTSGSSGSPRSPCSSPPSRSAARSCRCACRSTRRSPA